ncbi:MAG: hypothetical protein KC589_06160 [Nanoarchaeota archaeon]|nr:hypothetical protein [Nanoarchaeota archaeon]
MSNVEFFKEQEEFEFNHFERIENPKSLRQDVCAMLILDSIIPSEKNLIKSIESYNNGKLMYFILNISDTEIEELLTEDDIIDLLRCGIFYDQIINYCLILKIEEELEFNGLYDENSSCL